MPLDSSGSLAGHGTERLGTDVAFAGSELLMGAPSEASWEDQNDYDDDVAWVTVGGRAAFVSQRTALDDEWHDLVDGAGPARSAPDNQFGASVLAPGDVTGDGVDDLMVG